MNFQHFSCNIASCHFRTPGPEGRVESERKHVTVYWLITWVTYIVNQWVCVCVTGWTWCVICQECPLNWCINGLRVLEFSMQGFLKDLRLINPKKTFLLGYCWNNPSHLWSTKLICYLSKEIWFNPWISLWQTIDVPGYGWFKIKVKQ